MKVPKSILPSIRLPKALRIGAEKSVAGEEKAPGLPPGSLIHVGVRMQGDPTLSVVDYSPDQATFAENIAFEDLGRMAPPGEGQVRWINETGLHDVELISAIGAHYSVDPLVLEDILNTASRPKLEEGEKFLFISMRLLTSEKNGTGIESQQFAVVLLEDNTILSFLEAPIGAFKPVENRIRTGGGGRIRRFGSDYLMWALLDTVVDHYLAVLDRMDEALVAMEEKLNATEGEGVDASELYRLKREFVRLYRDVRPIRDIAGWLYRADSERLSERCQPFLRDLYDHAVQVLEGAEDLRESASALRDYYLSAVSHRMNEVMKVLTCFATIFLPLTFFAGIYGMNFERMPELALPWAYPALWIAFIVMAAAMFWYFRRRRWL